MRMYHIFTVALILMILLPGAVSGRSQIEAGDVLILQEGASSFREGSYDGTALDGDAVELEPSAGKDMGSYTSPLIGLSGAPLQIIPSWNIICGKDEGWLVELQVKNREGAISPWFYTASEGSAAPADTKVTQCSWARIDVDNLKLEKPASAVRYRVSLRRSSSSGSSLSLKRFALAWRTSAPEPGGELDASMMEKSGPLPVRWRSQHAEAKEISSRICCPTSTSMVLEYLGINRPTADIAEMLYTAEHDIYGVWWKPPQLACQLGLKGWVRLFSTWREVQAVLLEGQPVIASISYGAGELKGSPCPSTKGHLVVITGFDRTGRVCVNDPAGRTEETGRVTYDRLEFGKAWFGHGGVAIIISRNCDGDLRE